MIPALRSLNPVPALMRLQAPNRVTVIFGLAIAAGLSYAAFSLARRMIFQKTNFDLGFQAYKDGNFELAVTYYDKALRLSEKKPPAPMMHFVISKACLELENYGRAINECEEAMKGDHKDFEDDLYLHMGHAYQGLGKRSEAVKCYAQARDAVNPEHRLYSVSRHIEILLGPCQILLENEESDLVRNLCFDVIKLCQGPKCAQQLLFARCFVVRSYLGQPDTALLLLNDIKLRQESNPFDLVWKEEILVLEADIYHQQKKYAEEIENRLTALQISYPKQNRTKAYLKLALACEHAGDLKRAYFYYTIATYYREKFLIPIVLYNKAVCCLRLELLEDSQRGSLDAVNPDCVARVQIGSDGKERQPVIRREIELPKDLKAQASADLDSALLLNFEQYPKSFLRFIAELPYKISADPEPAKAAELLKHRIQQCQNALLTEMKLS